MNTLLLLLCISGYGSYVLICGVISQPPLCEPPLCEPSICVPPSICLLISYYHKRGINNKLYLKIIWTSYASCLPALPQFGTRSGVPEACGDS